MVAARGYKVDSHVCECTKNAIKELSEEIKVSFAS